MAARMRDILILSKKWSHGRGRFTSVERFCELVDPQFPHYHGKRITLHPRITNILKNHTNSLSSEDYSAPYNSFSAELELWGLWQAIKGKYKVVFFPYADYDYFYWQYFKKMLGIKVILWSFFSEKELQTRFKNLHHFEKADLVLVAGKAQLEYLAEHAPKAKLHYFPIGVDTEFFTPGDQFDPYRIVHVGNNRRDFGTLIKGMDQVYQKFPQLHIDLVGASSNKSEIPKRPYLVIHDELRDSAYRDILQKSNFAVLSLADGGSSNSVQETSACGLPLIVTDLPNIRDYICDSFAMIYSIGDHHLLAELTLHLLYNVNIRNQMAKAARSHIREYSWEALKDHFYLITHQV